MSLPAHPLPAERSLGGWVGGRACSKFSSGEGEPQLVWCGSRALDSRFRKGERLRQFTGLGIGNIGGC